MRLNPLSDDKAPCILNCLAKETCMIKHKQFRQLIPLEIMIKVAIIRP